MQNALETEQSLRLEIRLKSFAVVCLRDDGGNSTGIERNEKVEDI